MKQKPFSYRLARRPRRLHVDVPSIRSPLPDRPSWCERHGRRLEGPVVHLFQPDEVRERQVYVAILWGWHWSETVLATWSGRRIDEARVVWMLLEWE